MNKCKFRTQNTSVKRQLKANWLLLHCVEFWVQGLLLRLLARSGRRVWDCATHLPGDLVLHRETRRCRRREHDLAAAKTTEVECAQLRGVESLPLDDGSFALHGGMRLARLQPPFAWLGVDDVLKKISKIRTALKTFVANIGAKM